MKKFVVASPERSAGKTSLIAGVAAALGAKCGYVKPIGDRLLYRKKRLWDHDAALFVALWKLDTKPEDITIGFEHAKLRYMYDEEGRKRRLRTMLPEPAPPDAVLLVEGGRDLSCGASVHLDAVSLARYLDARLVLVVAGPEDQVLDEVSFVRKYVGMREARFAGVVVNKVRDVAAFAETTRPHFAAQGLPLLGVLPRRDELTQPSVGFLVDRLFAKVITGEKELRRTVRHIFIGAMSADAAARSPLFGKPGKLIITSGDRTDMILAALDSDTACVLLTNNVLPPPSVISRATDRGVPLVLVPQDTYQVASQVDDLEPLLAPEETEKIALLGDLVRDHVELGELLGAA
jgi:BioD-like phosphotransacetylase family protein